MKRWFLGMKNKKALACIDWIKDCSSRGCHYDTGVEKHGKDTIEYVLIRGWVEATTISGGISIGDWDYKFKGLVLTEKGKRLARNESERDKNNSDKARYSETLLTGFLYTVAGGIVVGIIMFFLLKQ